MRSQVYTDGEISGINEIDLRLHYYDEASASWPLAVDGNTTGTATFRGGIAPTATLGDYGVDLTNNIVWAVVDHFTIFGVGGTGTGGWVLQSTPTNGIDTFMMWQGHGSQPLTTVGIPSTAAYVWVSDAPATVATTFMDPFGGQIMFPAGVAGPGTFTVEVGSWSGGGFVVGDSGILTMTGASLYDMDALNVFGGGAEPESFVVPAGQYLAMRITNHTGADQDILTGGLRSWLNATNSDNKPYPTVITLTSFTAEETETGILLKWHTESEVENAGFHIWRSMEEDTGYLRITGNLIPAEGSEARSADYAYTDTTVQANTRYYYKLEDIGNDGTSTLHNPVGVGENAVTEPEEGGGDDGWTPNDTGDAGGNNPPAGEGEETGVGPETPPAVPDTTPPPSGNEEGEETDTGEGAATSGEVPGETTGQGETPTADETTQNTDPPADAPENVVPDNGDDGGDGGNGDADPSGDKGNTPEDNSPDTNLPETKDDNQPSGASDETASACDNGGNDSNCFIGSMMVR